MEVTAQEVAEWMVKEIRFTGTLHQTAAIEYVKENFGEQFVFVNENGNAPWWANRLGSGRIFVGVDLSWSMVFNIKKQVSLEEETCFFCV